MAYKKKSSFSKSSKKYSKSSKSPKTLMTPRTATQTIKKYVKLQIAKQIENKCSVSNKFEMPVMKWIATDPEFFNANYQNFFNLSQGVDQGQRVGNTIRLKRWVIKGFVTPTNALPAQTNNTPFDPASFQGQVRLMLVRKRNNAPLDPALSQLLQNGNSAVNPLGTQFDKLYPINKDQYKVFWERIFKVGPAGANPTAAGLQYYPFQANNDFKMTESFGLDVTQYIGKDAKITYNDGTTQSVLPGYMNNLTMIAYWSPFTANCTQSTVNYLSWYKISMVSYFEYEDA